MFELTRRAFNKFVFGTVAGGVIVGRRKALAAEQMRRDLSRVIKYRRIFRRWGAMWVPVQFEEIRRGDDVLALDLDDGVLSMMERWRVDGDPERIKGEPYNAGVKVGVSANLLTWPMEVKGAEADKDACPVSFYGATSGMGRRLFVQSFHVTKCDCVGVPVGYGEIDKRWTVRTYRKSLRCWRGGGCCRRAAMRFGIRRNGHTWRRGRSMAGPCRNTG